MVNICCYCCVVVDTGFLCVKCVGNSGLSPRFRHGDEMLTIIERQYAQGNGLRLDLVDSDGAPYATLTKNPAPMTLDVGHVLVKTCDENAGVARSALASGLFTDTGARVPSGYYSLEVWRYNIEA